MKSLLDFPDPSDLVDVPDDIVMSFRDGGITRLLYEDRLRMLTDPALRMENGSEILDDARGMVAVSCLIPDVTLDMVSWWEWWYPGHPDAYRTWLPDSNQMLTYDESCADYFEADVQPEFRPYTLYPEQIYEGNLIPFRVEIENPSAFGYTEEEIASAGNPLVYCGRVMSRKGRIHHADLVYMMFGEGDGVRFSCRMWMGWDEPSLFQRLVSFNRHTLMMHGLKCYREYSALGDILPDMYRRYGPKKG